MTWRVSDEDLGALGEKIVATIGARASHIAHGELTVGVEAEDIVEALTRLRDDPDLAFQQLDRYLRRGLPAAPKAVRRRLPPAIADQESAGSGESRGG